MSAPTAPMEFFEPIARLGSRVVDGLAHTVSAINRIPNIFFLELGGASVSAVVAKHLTAEHPGNAMMVASLGLVCTMGAFANNEI